MKQVFTTHNSVEAHMIAHLLESNDVQAFVDGTILQGAIGELPVGDYIKVSVSNDNFAKAKEIIAKWEKENPIEKTPEVSNSDEGNSSFLKSFIILIIGAFLGYLFSDMINNFLQEDINKETALKEDIDRNSDGKADAIYYYRNYDSRYPSIFEEDSNFDGQIDGTYKYNLDGIVSSSELDTNFDSTINYKAKFNAYGQIESDISDFDGDAIFESKTIYEYAQPVKMIIDSDNDGKTDYTTLIENFIPKLTLFHNPKTGKVFKMNHYKNSILDRVEIDTDKDGILDTVRTYDKYEELINSEKISTD